MPGQQGGRGERTPLLAAQPCAPGQPQQSPGTAVTLGAAKGQDDDAISLLHDPFGWARSLLGGYSWRLLTMVACTSHLLKGFVAGGGDDGLIGKPIEFIFNDMGIHAGRLQMFKAAAVSPWALKPVIALISDGAPIFGYKKMPYVVIFTAFALVGTLLIGFNVAQSVPAIVACLFFIFLQVSSVDLLVEARQSEEIKAKSKMGPQFLTFTWLGITWAQVAAVCLMGPLLYHAGNRVSYLIAAPCIALVLWPTLCNFLGEKRLPPEERGLQFALVKQHPVLCSLTLLIGALVTALIVSTFLLSEAQLMIVIASIIVVVLTGIVTFIRPEIAKPVLFYFLLGLSTINIDGAMFYFYTDSPLEYIDGPHFTSYFYTTGLGMVSFVGVMVGFTTGEVLFKHWSYRGILQLSILLRACTQLAMLPVLLRWTGGIHWRFFSNDVPMVLTVTMLDSVVFAWRWIPKQVMSAHLTPKGVEATMRGLTAGTFNMAMILSSYVGASLLHALGVAPRGEPGEAFRFDNLWQAQVIAALAPCAMLFLLPALIPAKSQTELLITDHVESATHGSLYESFKRQRPAAADSLGL